MNDDFRWMFEEVNGLVESGEWEPGEAIACVLEECRQARIEYLDKLTVDKVLSEFESKLDDDLRGLERSIALEEAMAVEIVKWRKMVLRRLSS